MAYEKYIKKDGKLYGPYIYHSKRIDGRVVSEYHGQGKPWKKFLWTLPVIVLIIIGAYFIGQQGNKATGYSILGIDAYYQEGKILEGNLNLQLQQGELVPATSSVVFENREIMYRYSLADMVLEQETEGDFFITGKDLSGFGLGYGIAGTKIIFPEVGFTLLIYSETNEADIESEREIPGSVTAEEIFVYELQAGEGAELKPRSVMAEGKQLEDKAVSIIKEGNVVSVTTQYTEEEKGFGADYNGEKTKNINIDLTSLNLILQPGVLDVSVIYNSEELFFLQTIIGENSVSGESQQQEQPATTETNITEIQIRELELTTEEKNALEDEFGNISLVAEAKVKNGFIVLRYGLGNLWIEYSYSSDLSAETLNSLMEADRIKWLKDVAQSLTQPEEKEQTLENFTENYSY